MWRVKTVYREYYCERAKREPRTICTTYSEEYDNVEQAEQTEDFLACCLDERMADTVAETTIERLCGGEWKALIPAY